MKVDRNEIESFIYREACLMDEHAYEEWMKLWSADLLYWVPSNRDDSDPSREICAVYDDRASLETRIDRLKSGAAYAQDPKSRMRRLISNIEIDCANEEIVVWSNFILVELRHSQQQMFAGRTIHKLHREADRLKMHYKKVMLVNNDEPISNLTFLI